MTRTRFGQWLCMHMMPMLLVSIMRAAYCLKVWRNLRSSKETIRLPKSGSTGEFELLHRSQWRLRQAPWAISHYYLVLLVRIAEGLEAGLNVVGCGRDACSANSGLCHPKARLEVHVCSSPKPSSTVTRASMSLVSAVASYAVMGLEKAVCQRATLAERRRTGVWHMEF